MCTQYEELKAGLARGWNTWNTRSVLSHVLLPESFAVNVGLRHPTDGRYLKEALFGKGGKDEEHVRPGPHATDGSYTEVSLEWRGVRARAQSAVEDGDLVLENYNADTGEGCDKSSSSDALYHWGGLLGFMALIEEGFNPGLE